MTEAVSQEQSVGMTALHAEARSGVAVLCPPWTQTTAQTDCWVLLQPLLPVQHWLKPAVVLLVRASVPGTEQA